MRRPSAHRTWIAYKAVEAFAFAARLDGRAVFFVQRARLQPPRSSCWPGRRSRWRTSRSRSRPASSRTPTAGGSRSSSAPVGLGLGFVARVSPTASWLVLVAAAFMGFALDVQERRRRGLDHGRGRRRAGGPVRSTPARRRSRCGALVGNRRRGGAGGRRPPSPDRCRRGRACSPSRSRSRSRHAARRLSSRREPTSVSGGRVDGGHGRQGGTLIRRNPLLLADRRHRVLPRRLGRGLRPAMGGALPRRHRRSRLRRARPGAVVRGARGRRDAARDRRRAAARRAALRG